MDKKSNKVTKPNKTPLTGLIALIVIAGILSVFAFYQTPSIREVSLSEFKQDLAKKEIKNNQILIEGDKITYEDLTGGTLFTYKENNSILSDILTQKEIQSLKVKVDPEGNFLFTLIQILPAILIVLFLFFIFRQAQNNNAQAMSFGRSQARLHDKTGKSAKFDDVAGAEEAKEELVEVVDFLKQPKKYHKMGAKIPKGVLLIGSPGTGKTLLARAVAGEADVPFFSISGSEFVEMFVGVGASRVRDLFKKAKQQAPCIIFIDEIDAVGRKRGAGFGGGHDEREQTLNQILTEMDGFDNDTGIVVMAATNRPDVLDPALLRPGRFDRRVVVERPNINDREDILKVHTRNKPMAENIDLKVVARQTPGFAGADLENLVNEAAIMAAKHNQKNITQDNLERSIEKIVIGLEKKSRKLSKKELEITAYHEVGHAIVGHAIPECDPVNKISIIARGHALGVTWFLPTEDSHLYSRSKFEAEICSLLGGYCTEEIFFKEVTTGASNDLERATKIARDMVTKYGMSELGPIRFGEDNEEVFLGRDFAHAKNYSEAIAGKIDTLIHETIQKAYKRTKDIILENKDLLSKIAKDLLEKENINREEFLAYFPSKS